MTHVITPQQWADRFGLNVEHGPAGSLAVTDDTGSYRYLLARRWNNELPPVLFVMLNPSTADGTVDDPTVRRCCGFARRLGAGGIEIVNLFAARATAPQELPAHADPVGPYGNAVLGLAVRRHRCAIAAWGSATWDRTGLVRRRAADVALFLAEREIRTRCLGLTADGSPRHPLYLPADSSLLPYEGGRP